MPAALSPQLCHRPDALTAAKVSPPPIAVGVAVVVVVPFPSWPSALKPQQYPASPVVTPQLWNEPALSVAKVRPPSTSRGTMLQLSTVPRPAHFSVVAAPSWPSALSPQQYAAPPDVRPHACQ